MAQELDGQIIPTTAQTYLTQYLAAFREELGTDFVDDPQSPTGQLLRLMAEFSAVFDETVIASLNQSELETAIGDALDRLALLYGTQSRKPGAYTRARVNFTGTAGVRIPVGTRVRAVKGTVFEMFRGDVTIGVDGRVEGVLVRTQRQGSFPVAAGEINQIVDRAAGIATVNNPRESTLGRNLETDEEMRRRLLETTRTAPGFLDSIRGRMLALDGVTDAIVLANDTNASVQRQGVSIAAGSILCAVLGGDAEEVALTIWNVHPPGVPLDGSLTRTIRILNFQYEVKYSEITETQIKVNANIEANPAVFPTNGTEQIREQLLDYATNANTPLTVGASVDVNSLYNPMYNIPGHRVTSLTATLADDSPLPDPTPLLTVYRLQRENINLTVTQAT